MIDDLLMQIAVLGATRIEKAVPICQLKLIPNLKDGKVDEEIVQLESLGYVTVNQDMVYLTQTGLIRTFSRFS